MKALITRFFSASFVRFMMVGVVNTVIGAIIMFGSYNLLHVSYWPSTALNYFITSILSFFLNRSFTFHNKDVSVSQVLRFAVNIVVCYVVAYVAAIFITALFYTGQYGGFQNSFRQLWGQFLAGSPGKGNIAMIIGAVIFSLLNYVGQKFFAFRKKRDPETDGIQGEADANA